jgi:(2S)-methylsuccinyl-CoA dehydrogenase
MATALQNATTLIQAARGIIDTTTSRLADRCTVKGRIDLDRMDQDQSLAYELAHAASLVTAGEHMLSWAEDHDEAKGRLTLGFAGHMASELSRSIIGRGEAWGVDGLPWMAGPAAEALAVARSIELLDAIAEDAETHRVLDFGLDDELRMARDTFRDVARDQVAPFAEDTHSLDQDIPDEVLSIFSELGLFAMAIPESHGGLATGGPHGHSRQDLLAMLVATEEMCKASMGLAGPFITRPEILATVLLRGGTPDQIERWLPYVASGEKLVAIAVTEPDFGSDVANLTTTATRFGDTYRISGVKTWSTFAGRADLLLVLARTGRREDKHRGLSLLVVEKPRFLGHDWTHKSELGGTLAARAIRTIGYRGMHSFEISFDDFFVPASHLIGEDVGLGRGFYLQMNAFASGRMQTAARAVGLMSATLEDATRYAQERHVFGVALGDYQLTRAKLATSAFLIAACRVFTYQCANLIAQGGGQLEASMVKSFACRAAEWVTREGQQIHGGYGYAEEYAVARHFLDARVLSLFEGADETLALRVITRGLLDQARQSAEGKD